MKEMTLNEAIEYILKYLEEITPITPQQKIELEKILLKLKQQEDKCQQH